MPWPVLCKHYHSNGRIGLSLLSSDCFPNKINEVEKLFFYWQKEMHPLWSYTCKIAALQIQSLNYGAITFQDSQALSDSSGKTTTIFDIYTL